MNVAVLGGKLTALVVSATLAETGNQVTLVPLAKKTEKKLLRREHLNEPNLSDLIQTQINSGRLAIKTRVEDALQEVDVIILALPSGKIKAAEEVIQIVADKAQGQIDVVNMSAFPVGTSERFEALLRTKVSRRNHQERTSFSVSVVPEFIFEGRAIESFISPDRIILGVNSEQAISRLSQLFKPFSSQPQQEIIHFVSRRGAEYIKFAANAFVATRISLMNELANNAEHLGIDIEEVRQGIGRDSRIGFSYLHAGTGFGGANFAQDMQMLQSMLAQDGGESALIDTVLKNNEIQKEVLFRKLWRFYQGELQGKTIAIWGGAFKQNTGNITNAPSLKVIEALLAQGAYVRLHDPMASRNLDKKFGESSLFKTVSVPYEATDKADALLLLTEWKSYWNPDFSKIKSQLNTPLIIDGRNIYDPSLLKSMGFTYMGVGRGENML